MDEHIVFGSNYMLSMSEEYTQKEAIMNNCRHGEYTTDAGMTTTIGQFQMSVSSRPTHIHDDYEEEA